MNKNIELIGIGYSFRGRVISQLLLILFLGIFSLLSAWLMIVIDPMHGDFTFYSIALFVMLLLLSLQFGINSLFVPLLYKMNFRLTKKESEEFVKTYTVDLYNKIDSLNEDEKRIGEKRDKYQERIKELNS
jgi:uncharacterized protein YlxW (UPF0749 family)